MSASPEQRPPVVVLFGGPSVEHDVSIVSGTAIAAALESDGFTVQRVVIAMDGQWWWLPRGHDHTGRAAAAYDDPGSLGAEGPFRVWAALDRLAETRPAPVVFVALHGPFGEDGTVQALLDVTGLAYTGSGVLGSAIGMDKAVQKRIWRGLGLPVLDWREVRVARWAADQGAVLTELEAFVAAAGDPRLMIKPARLGSSVGMTLAHGPHEWGPGLDLAFRFDSLAVVEPYLANARDLEVSIIGTEPPLGVYGPGEIVAGHEFYDYAAKYTPGLSETSAHAEVPRGLQAAMQKIARDAYRSVGAEGFARVDFLVSGESAYLSEINTIPGFTPISLFPTMPAEAGLDFVDVCRRIIDLAVQRQVSRTAFILTVDDLPR
ncbi:MAG: D-alanine--D-alanine ligase family protein [Chloroflexota bacterium]